jgi:tRNA(adenine34) deaminase
MKDLCILADVMHTFQDPYWLSPRHMARALELAQIAAAIGEVPVGAVIIQDHDPKSGKPLESPQVISEKGNDRELSKNPLGHAELLAIKEASEKLDRWRLSGCTLYVTLEPCLMCSGAIVLSRVDRVVYGATDPKAGAVQSLYQTLTDGRLNHRPEVIGGVMADECSKILKDFFAAKRNQG